MNEKQVIDLIHNSTTEQEWNVNYEALKKAGNGHVPILYQTLMLSHLVNNIRR